MPNALGIDSGDCGTAADDAKLRAMSPVTSPTVRLAIVGCGAIAESVHIPAVKASSKTEVVALIDSDPVRAEAAALKHGVRRYGTDLLEFENEVDAVVICTPPHVHPAISLGAFAAGLHVQCEKPFANSVRDCEEIIKAARKAKRVLSVTHIFRFWPSRQEMKKIISSQEFGKVQSVTVTQGNPYTWRTETGYNMQPGLVPGGVLFDAGIHPLDTILWWFGEPQLLDYEDDALGGIESNVRLSLRFPGVPLVQFRQSRTAPMSNEFRVETERATLVLSNYSLREIRIRQGGEETIRYAGSAGVDHRTCELSQLEDFVDSIHECRDPAVTGESARDVISLIEKCYAMRADRALLSKAPIPGLTSSSWS